MSRNVKVPEPIRAALEDGAALAISVSGGKDSMAMATALVALVDREGWPGEVYAIHADLGRMEWGGYESEDHWLSTLGHVRAQAERLGLPLVVVRREDRDLLGHMQARRERLEEQNRHIPFWPSAASRYCTSDMKRAVIDKYLRRHDFLVCAMGIRSDESARRAKSKPCDIRQQITSQAKCYGGIDTVGALLTARQEGRRVALDWNPILEWSEDDVWQAVGHSLPELRARRSLWREGRKAVALDGWIAHPAYVLGNERLSCALCILGSPADLENGAQHNPKLFAELVEMERESGFTFQQRFSLVELAEKLQRQEAA